MGKLSSVMMFLLMVNIIGYIVLASAGQDTSSFVGQDALLSKLYTPPADLHPVSGSQSATFTLGDSTGLAGSVPQEAPDTFFSATGQFLDRIFALFSFIRVVIAFLFVPAALFGYGLALPWEITLLLGVPLATLYVVGLIDLVGGGDS